MKPYLLLAVIINTVMAQNYTVLGGVTYATVRYNSAVLQKVANVGLLTGIVLGTESEWGDFRLGGLYIQQGFVSNVKAGDTIIEGSETVNYLMPYLIYVQPLNPKSSLFGGLGIGTALGGKSNDTDGASNLKARLFNLDTQLLLGIDITLSPRLALRSNIYVGLRDVIANLDPESNYKNQCVSMALLYRR